MLLVNQTGNSKGSMGGMSHPRASANGRHVDKNTCGDVTNNDVLLTNIRGVVPECQAVCRSITKCLEDNLSVNCSLINKARLEIYPLPESTEQFEEKVG